MMLTLPHRPEAWHIAGGSPSSTSLAAENAAVLALVVVLVYAAKPLSQHIDKRVSACPAVSLGGIAADGTGKTAGFSPGWHSTISRKLIRRPIGIPAQCSRGWLCWA